MSSKVDWKQKYFELRSKYMNALDTAYRLGVQEGAKASKIQQLEAEMAAQKEMEAQAQPGMEGQDPAMQDPAMQGGEPGQDPMEAQPEMEGGDELGSAIGELEQYVKNEGTDGLVQLLKSFHSNKESKENEDTHLSKKRKEVDDIISKF